MFKIKQLNCCQKLLNARTEVACRYLWLTLWLVALLGLGFNTISIGTLFAQENDARAKLTELLFNAVKTNNINRVRIAIEAGAELSRINLNGQTAMDIAISNNHYKIANYLVFARRIEQQANLKSTPMINSVQQSSPEAAPVINITIDNLPETQQPEVENKSLNSTVKQKEKKKSKPSNIKQKEKKKSKPSNIKQIKIATRKIASQDATVTKISKAEFKTPQKKLKAISSTAEYQRVAGPGVIIAEQELNTSKLIFFIDANGNLIKSSEAEIQRIQKTIRQKAERLLPDIEPRKSLFIPKPRFKPNFSPLLTLRPIPRWQNQTPKSATELDVIVPETSKSNSSLDQVPNVKTISSFQESESRITEVDYFRPTRRISPELLKKLRRGLEETKRQQKISAGGKEKLTIKKINMPSISQQKQRENDQTVLFPTTRVHPKKPLTVEPTLQLNDKADMGESESKKTDFFGKLFSDLTHFLGFTSVSQEVRKKRKPLGEKAQTKILFQQSKNSKERIIETKTIDQPAKKRSLPKLSLRLQPQKYEQTNSQFKAVEGSKVSVNNSIGQFLKKPRQTNLEPNKRDIIQRELITNKRIKSNTGIDTKAKHINSFQIEQKLKDTVIRQPNVSMPLTRLRKPLKNTSLILGNSATTGQSKLPLGIAEPNPCIHKRRGEISFCIIPIDWPQKIGNSFSTNTSLYQGTRAIARYDNGKATHFHALYKSADQDKVINFIKQRYGPPTEVWKRVIAPFGKPRQPNPTFVWRNLDIKTNKVTILEIRKFDDTRTVFPDTKHGAIRLYLAGGPAVFPIITAHDIMSLDWAARSDHYIDNDLPALARTIRVQP